MNNTTKEFVAESIHVPVLLQEVIQALALSPEDVVVDGTLGGGGHANEILNILGEQGRYIGIDADTGAIERVEARIGNDPRVSLIQGNFRDIDKHMRSVGVEGIDKVLLDIGISSDQLENDSARGFSFLKDEPLKMTFVRDPKIGELTAWHVVNEWSESSLADVIFGFGGEHRARRIARAICEARDEKPIHTSKRLAEVIARAVSKVGHVHPATKTFQAIRIAVNDELGALEDVLQKGRALLRPHGRIVVITFHSLEDRLVKRMFSDWEDEGLGVRLTKKPITPSREEVVHNKRARSAKLRCFVRA